MQYISNILFLILLIVGFGLFFKSLKELVRNVNLGKDIDRSDNKNERWAIMGRVALGQGKMVKRPVAGILHILVYLGFIIVNLELIEIFVDGLLVPTVSLPEYWGWILQCVYFSFRNYGFSCGGFYCYILYQKKHCTRSTS